MRKEVKFVIEFDNNCRVREYFVKSKGIILEFAIQLEIKVRKKWIAIRRYDTAHGYIHCDITHANGNKEKQPIPAGDFNEALSIAEHDLRKLWQFYRDQFLREVENYGEK